MSATDFIQNHLPVEIPDGSVGRFGQVKATATVVIFRLSRDRTAVPDQGGHLVLTNKFNPEAAKIVYQRWL